MLSSLKKSLCILFFVCLSPAWATEVTLDLHIESDSKGTIVSLKTNLPPKTRFTAMMISPENQGGDGGIWESRGAVQTNQIFQFEPFSKNGKRLPSGFYVLHISALSTDLQPEEIQAAFGAKGARLTGPNVKRDAIENMVYRLYRLKIGSDGAATQ